MPLIKPKERRVLSFRAMALCKNRGGQPVIPVTEGREREKRYRDLVKRALARKFAPIPFYSRDLDQLVLLLQNRAKPTRVTRSSARIAHGRSKTPLLPFSLSFSLRFSLGTHLLVSFASFCFKSSALVSLCAIN